MFNIIRQHKGKLFIGLNYIALRSGLYGSCVYDLHDENLDEYMGVHNYNFWLFNKISYWIDDQVICCGPFSHYSLKPMSINHYDKDNNLIKTYDRSDIVPFWVLPFFMIF